MTAQQLETETPAQARSRLISDALRQRSLIFRMMEIADDGKERDRLFEQWKQFTLRIEELNR